MISEKGLEALVSSHQPKALGKDMYGKDLKPVSYQVNESKDMFRLSNTQIEEKIKKLQNRAEKNPEDVSDIEAEIKELQSILTSRKSKNESYLNTLERLGKVK